MHRRVRENRNLIRHLHLHLIPVHPSHRSRPSRHRWSLPHLCHHYHRPERYPCHHGGTVFQIRWHLRFQFQPIHAVRIQELLRFQVLQAYPVRIRRLLRFQFLHAYMVRIHTLLRFQFRRPRQEFQIRWSLRFHTPRVHRSRVLRRPKFRIPEFCHLIRRPVHSHPRPIP